MARPHWWRLLLHVAVSAATLALVSAVRSSAAKMAMMAMTTSNSINVKPHTVAARAARRSLAAGPHAPRSALSFMSTLSSSRREKRRFGAVSRGPASIYHFQSRPSSAHFRVAPGRAHLRFFRMGMGSKSLRIIEN
jgi:hypothetical protein